MALTLKILGIGQLSSLESTIVAGSTNKGTLVQNISLTNVTASNVTVNGIWVKVADPSAPGAFLKRLVSPQNFVIAPNAQFVLENDITLGSTATFGVFSGSIPDSLVAKASTPNAIDYVVCGMERDA